MAKKKKNKKNKAKKSQPKKSTKKKSAPKKTYKAPSATIYEPKKESTPKNTGSDLDIMSIIKIVGVAIAVLLALSLITDMSNAVQGLIK